MDSNAHSDTGIQIEGPVETPSGWRGKDVSKDAYNEYGANNGFDSSYGRKYDDGNNGNNRGDGKNYDNGGENNDNGSGSGSGGGGDGGGGEIQSAVAERTRTLEESDYTKGKNYALSGSGPGGAIQGTDPGSSFKPDWADSTPAYRGMYTTNGDRNQTSNYRSGNQTNTYPNNQNKKQ